MMDPLRSMMMTGALGGDHYRDQTSQQNIVTVEEGMDCREANSRFFSLLNRETRLNVIVSKNAAILSCRLAGHEIVVDHQRLCNQTHETWSIGDRPYQKICSLPLNCHVRGAELVLSTSNYSSSIVYELTRSNELNSIVRLRSIHIQHQVTYFNLNNAKEKASIDGHTLVVQCNGSLNRIQVQNTKLLCQCNKNSSILPQSLIGDIPFELVQHDASISQNGDGGGATQRCAGASEDDLIVCDAIFSLESTCALDFLRVQLKYNDRTLLFEVRASPSSSAPNQQSSNNSSANVSSTTTTSKSTKTLPPPSDLQAQQATSSSGSPTTAFVSSGSAVDDSNECRSQDKWFSSLVDQPSPSSSSSCQSRISHPPPTSAGVLNRAVKSDGGGGGSSGPSSFSSHPSTILRARIRVTNFGICIMPLMMTSYTCTYRFAW